MEAEKSIVANVLRLGPCSTSMVLFVNRWWCCCTSMCRLLLFDFRLPSLISSQLKFFFGPVCTCVSRKLRCFPTGTLHGRLPMPGASALWRLLLLEWNLSVFWEIQSIILVLKGDSDTGFFLWIFQNFKHLQWLPLSDFILCQPILDVPIFHYSTAILAECWRALKIMVKNCVQN